jgi:secreted trypsin-like serine protease
MLWRWWWSSIHSKETNGSNHLLVGISIAEEGCALPHYPEVYARVSYAIDWILETGCSWVDGECDIQIN